MTPKGYPKSPDTLVDDVVAQLDEVTETVRARFGGLSTEQLAWQPGPTRWGIGHCLVHLARTGELYRATLVPTLAGARAAGRTAPRPLKGRWFGRLFTKMVGPGGWLKAKAPKGFHPKPETVAEGSLETFLAEQHRLRDVAESARGLDLDGLVIPSPVSSLFRFAVGDALRIVAAHEWRHLGQAERVLAEAGFPR